MINTNKIKILESKKQGNDTSALEAEIDGMVYELYGLTEEEIPPLSLPLEQKH